MLRAGDGSFRANTYSNTDQFRTGAFDTKSDRAVRSSFATGDRGFATKAVPVDQAPAATKSAPIRPYLPADKSTEMRGKRQGDLDELYHQKNLSIDQVREILNKPGHGTDAPAVQVETTPVFRSRPLTAPAVQ